MSAADYGAQFADVYDDLFGALDAGAAVDAIAALAGHGSVLELGIGTGRLALPLRARGVRIQGVDASTHMVEKLRAKPGGDALAVTIGDFAELALPETFDVVFVAFNTLFALTTPEAQTRCFERVAAHLAPNGCFVVEAFVPDPSRFDRGQSFRTLDVSSERVIVEASLHDAAKQTVRTAFVIMKPGGNEIRPLEIRYAWPAELDAMAKSAGLRVRDRWADWKKTPFGSRSASHVTVYAKG